MRVDDVPPWLSPAFLTYGYGGGLALNAMAKLNRRLLRWRWTGLEHIETQHVLCGWHETWWVAFLGFEQFPPSVWMNHAAWYMKPLHVACGWRGVEDYALGSTGDGGRAAADRLLEALAEGYCTLVLPDGPRGPARELRKCVLHIAAKSGVPIVPMQVRCSRAVHFPSWDRKLIPLPGATIDIELRPPFSVDPARLDEAERTLVAALTPT